MLLGMASGRTVAALAQFSHSRVYLIRQTAQLDRNVGGRAGYIAQLLRALPQKFYRVDHDIRKNEASPRQVSQFALVRLLSLLFEFASQFSQPIGNFKVVCLTRQTAAPGCFIATGLGDRLRVNHPVKCC